MNKPEFLKRLSVIAGVAALAGIAGCSTSGGSPNSYSVPSAATPFNTWQAITPGQTIQATGFSIQATYAADSSGAVQIIGGGSQGTGGANYVGFYDNSLNLSLLTLQSTNGFALTFDKTNGDTIASMGVGGMSGPYIGATSSNGRNSAILADPIGNGWSYQSYGVWMTGQGVGGTVGAITYGTPTTVLPTTGTASFVGNAAAIYTSPNGLSAFATANMNANVDFGALTVQWGTSNTMLGNSAVAKNVTSMTAAPQLNANGLLTISGTQFTGAAQTNNLNLNGQATGQFYGPNATEIGGTFGLKGNGVESLVGAFGGKAQ